MSKSPSLLHRYLELVQVSSRAPTMDEQERLDQAWSSYMSMAEGAGSHKELGIAWDEYQRVMDAMGARSTMLGYRIDL